MPADDQTDNKFADINIPSPLLYHKKLVSDQPGFETSQADARLLQACVDQELASVGSLCRTHEPGQRYALIQPFTTQEDSSPAAFSASMNSSLSLRDSDDSGVQAKNSMKNCSSFATVGDHVVSTSSNPYLLHRTIDPATTCPYLSIYSSSSCYGLNNRNLPYLAGINRTLNSSSCKSPPISVKMSNKGSETAVILPTASNSRGRSSTGSSLDMTFKASTAGKLEDATETRRASDADEQARFLDVVLHGKSEDQGCWINKACQSFRMEKMKGCSYSKPNVRLDLFQDWDSDLANVEAGCSTDSSTAGMFPEEANFSSDKSSLKITHACEHMVSCKQESGKETPSNPKNVEMGEDIWTWEDEQWESDLVTP